MTHEKKRCYRESVGRGLPTSIVGYIHCLGQHGTIADIPARILYIFRTNMDTRIGIIDIMYF